jgi:hypothetical protein
MRSERLVINERSTVADLPIGNPRFVTTLVEERVKQLFKFRSADAGRVRKRKGDCAGLRRRCRNRRLRVTLRGYPDNERQSQEEKERQQKGMFDHAFPVFRGQTLDLDTKP